MAQRPDESQNLALELQDGYVCFGRSFGAEKSIAGELVFQTGMVGYPESITDPSYRGQMYAEEEFSHYMATSSLGAWLKEQGVPAITGVDTRALTKRIREEGSMLARLRQRTGPSPSPVALTNGAAEAAAEAATEEVEDWASAFEEIEWVDPNKKNLVAEGEYM